MSKRVTLIVMTLLLCGALAGPLGAQTTPPSGPLWTESSNAKVPADIARLNDHMNALAERLKPALVQVRVRRAAEAQTEGEQPGAPEERRTSGSGVMIRSDGYLVTNEHVVADAETIQVKLADGRRFVGRLVGKDERVDLALVKIEATGVPVAALGDSNRIRVGEFVLALGQPFGLEQSVSFGIVSRKGAPLMVAAPGFDFIQTDATVNPGNSGGPLVNMAGEVIGINSMAARNGTIGFAIPINLEKGLLPPLASKGKVEWGWLGVAIAEIGDDEVPKYQLKEARGVLIRNVAAGQPADKGGLKADDVVLAVDGAQIDGTRDLQRIIASTPVGRSVKLNVVRGGKEQELDVIVGSYQAAAPAPRPQQTPRRSPEAPAPKPPAPAPK